MADNLTQQQLNTSATLPSGAPVDLDQARAAARQRFKERVERGESVGCQCHDEPSGFAPVDADPEDVRCVAGVRFVDSGRVYYFDVCDQEFDTGDWVVVESSRGPEAARVVIAPHQVLTNQLDGDLKPIKRRLSDSDKRRMDDMRQQSAKAVRTFSTRIRELGFSMKPISASFNFDGSSAVLSFSAQDRVDTRDLARDMASRLGCRVEMQQVGQRDEARLLGGVGRCGRTLCCSTWLPMFPEVNMGMGKVQDLQMNPSKVSGVCGRLLCCLSYENEQYRQMKSVMPKLGQTVSTPRGEGKVIAMQILKDQVTIRFEEEASEVTYEASELGFGSTPPKPSVDPEPLDMSKLDAVMGAVDRSPSVADPPSTPKTPDQKSEGKSSRPKRKRRRRRRRGGGKQQESS